MSNNLPTDTFHGTAIFAKPNDGGDSSTPLNRKLEVMSGSTRLAICREKYEIIRTMYNRSARIGMIQEKHDQDIVSLMIFFVVGLHNLNSRPDLHLNSARNAQFHGLRPASIKLVASITSVSREGVRRRLANLQNDQLISKVDGNFVVSNWPVWEEILEIFMLN